LGCFTAIKLSNWVEVIINKTRVKNFNKNLKKYRYISIVEISIKSLFIGICKQF
jgi:hypothetical protein